MTHRGCNSSFRPSTNFPTVLSLAIKMALTAVNGITNDDFNWANFRKRIGMCAFAKIDFTSQNLENAERISYNNFHSTKTVNSAYLSATLICVQYCKQYTN